MGSFRTKIGVVGAGRFGIALSELAARNGHDVVLFTTLPRRSTQLRKHRRLKTVLPELDELSPRVQVTTSAAELAKQCTLVLMTVSTVYIDRALEPLGQVLDGAHLVVHAVHTLRGAELERLSDVIQDFTAVKQVGVIAGPTHVSELLNAKPNAAEVGSAFPNVIRAVKDALGNEYVRVYGNPDTSGVELSAALGQIVATAVGLADGVGLGAAPHATLLTRGLQEAASIGTRFGATESTFSGLAGLGRLVDAVRRGEPNYELGIALAKAEDPKQVLVAAPPEAQSIDVIRNVCAFADVTGIDIPITRAVSSVFDGEATPAEALDRVLTRR